MTFFPARAEPRHAPLHGGCDAFAVVENRRPRDEHIRSCGNRQRGSCRIDASVHFEAACRLDLIDHLPCTADLRQHRVEKVLMPKSGIHGHDQNLIEVLHEVFENGGRSCWINGDADALSHAFDALHGARQIVVSLPVHRTSRFWPAQIRR